MAYEALHMNDEQTNMAVRMVTLIVEEHRELINDILLRYSLPIEIVDIRSELPNTSGSPFRVAFTGHNSQTGNRKIFILNTISQDRMDGIISRIQHPSTNLLQDPVLFLKHLLLHEIRHLQHAHDCLRPETREQCEVECDDWAFQQLNCF